MKIQSRAIEDTLRKHANYKAFLIYGPDTSIAEDHLKTLISLFTAKDAGVNVERLRAEKVKSEPFLLGEAVSSFSLLSDSSLIVLEDATDTLTSTIQDIVASDTCQNFLVVMAHELGPRSSLRGFFEKDQKVAAIACYEDSDQASLAYVRRLLNEQGIKFQDDAVHLLVSLTGHHRGLLQGNVSKLALYLEAGESFTLDIAKTLFTSQDESSLDDFCFQALDKNRVKLSVSLANLLSQNVQPIAIMRAVSRYTERLILLKQATLKGQNQKDAFKSGVRPPVFYMHEQKYAEHLSRFSLPTLLGILHAVTDQEEKLKRSASPSLSITRFFLS